jgi:hypothetical protein
MTRALPPGSRSTMYFSLFLVLLSSLLIATTTVPAQRNNAIMRERRRALEEQERAMERQKAERLAEERALRQDPIHIERLHRRMFGSVSSPLEVRLE